MNNSGDAAEQVVRLSLEGFEVAAKVTGEAAKNIAILLLSALKQEQKTKGKARLTNMIKSGKELKVFSVEQKDLKKFTEQAKRYGVLYNVLRDKTRKHDEHATVDIIARAEDASKIQRIFERFELGKVDKASIVSQIEKELAEKEASKNKIPEKSKADLVIEEALSTPAAKKEEKLQNPLSAPSDKSHLSKPSLSNTEQEFNSKPSVRKQLDEFKALDKKEKETVGRSGKSKNKKKSKKSKEK